MSKKEKKMALVLFDFNAFRLCDRGSVVFTGFVHRRIRQLWIFGICHRAAVLKEKSFAANPNPRLTNVMEHRVINF